MAKKRIVKKPSKHINFEEPESVPGIEPLAQEEPKKKTESEEWHENKDKPPVDNAFCKNCLTKPKCVVSRIAAVIFCDKKVTK
jgi:hypothetical protein